MMIVLIIINIIIGIGLFIYISGLKMALKAASEYINKHCKDEISSGECKKEIQAEVENIKKALYKKYHISR